MGALDVKRALLAALALVALFLMPVPAHATPNGLFWLRCEASHTLNDDPIVRPGLSGASHLHEFFGNEGTDASSTYLSLVVGTTTCHLAADTAAYWFPALIEPGGTVVPAISINAYYWGEKGLTEPFPPDFRELAGATVGTMPNPGGHVYYQCQGTSTLKSATLPNCGAGNRVKGQVEFPSCWNGTLDLNATDDLAYPNGDVCPNGYQRHVPRLVLHIQWDTDDASQDSLVSDAGLGVDHGLSLHADFLNAWQPGALEALVASCVTSGASCRNMDDR